jgi:hypothetical protein
LEEWTLARVWLESGRWRATYEGIVYNPRPTGFVNAAPPNVLNSYSGLRYTRTEVEEYTDWNCIGFILNHIRFAMCNNTTEYKETIYHFARDFQRQWIKLQQALAIGGDEGCGKTIILEFVKWLLGDANCLILHNQNDATVS